MLFRVENLGPLHDAEVDLSKDIIVLAGPNNSGKTYLAWSVYGLHRMRPRPNVDLSRWVQQLVESPDHSIDLGKLLTEESELIGDSIAAQYAQQLHLCFAAEENRFAEAHLVIRQLMPKSQMDTGAAFGGMVWPNKPQPGAYSLHIQPDRIQWNLRLPEFELSSPHLWMMESAEAKAATSSAVKSLASTELQAVESITRDRLPEAVGSQLYPNCILFPAERIAVNIFAKELALERTKLVDEMVDAELDGRINAPIDLVRRKAGRYPWPIRDSLRTANDLANLQKRKSRFADLADELESGVLRGSVSVADTGELRFAPTDNKAASLEMHLTASVVKSLSSLVFYFRHLAYYGDFIIIDEPELNLHPDNQRLITRILAKAARRGIKIMMSTHSDYVLRELNHLIMLSKLPEDEAKDMGYDPMWAVAPDRIGVYLFDDHTAKPIPIDDTGFSIKTIDDVVDRLNADEQRLYARLFG